MRRPFRTRQPPFWWRIWGTDPTRYPCGRTMGVSPHLVRAVPTKTGFWYYFDTQGGAYIWSKGKLKLQHPKKMMNKQTLSHNKKGGYQLLSSTAGPQYGKSNRGRKYVHCGVAQAFPEICGTPDLFRNQVDHINNDMWDNRAKNLQWLSPSENVRKSKLKV